jgi:hypothetical protein
VSTADNIESIVFSQNGSGSGDAIGLDNLEVAKASAPEPGAWTLLLSAGLLMTLSRVRRASTR